MKREIRTKRFEMVFMLNLLSFVKIIVRANIGHGNPVAVIP